MAAHASFGGGNTGGSRGFDRSVAVATINSIIADVMLVAELHRLRTRNILAREIRRTREPQDSGKTKTSQENTCEETKPGDKIRAAVKNLGHVCVALWRVSGNGAGPKENPPSAITGVSVRPGRLRRDSVQQIFSNCNSASQQNYFFVEHIFFESFVCFGTSNAFAISSSTFGFVSNE
jgi:hypothetical protein